MSVLSSVMVKSSLMIYKKRITTWARYMACHKYISFYIYFGNLQKYLTTIMPKIFCMKLAHT